jgi:hypothetical protein
VTTAEMLRAEGEARAEARWRGEAPVEMLTVKFGSPPDSVPETVHAASTGQIRVACTIAHPVPPDQRKPTTVPPGSP